MFKRNDRPIEDILKEVCQENEVEYIPPEKRVPQTLIYIIDENGHRYFTAEDQEKIAAQNYKLSNEKLEDIMKEISAKEEWKYTPLAQRGPLDINQELDAQGDLIITIKRKPLIKNRTIDNTDFYIRQLFGAFNKTQNQLNYVATSDGRLLAEPNMAFHRKLRNASTHGMQVSSLIKVKDLEKLGIYLVTDPDGEQYLAYMPKNNKK